MRSWTLFIGRSGQRAIGTLKSLHGERRHVESPAPADCTMARWHDGPIESLHAESASRHGSGMWRGYVRGIGIDGSDVAALRAELCRAAEGSKATGANVRRRTE